ncbi:unnamed protein product [Dovyalis caffra]|uniref:Uncharacterized protein n=1 Tax=Dovyalis caffra TaxID=77055 RepID=A0AAV1R7Q4_9ROSI|nr:unnamed protein product [Dovyalis caffra]
MTLMDIGVLHGHVPSPTPDSVAVEDRSDVDTEVESIPRIPKGNQPLGPNSFGSPSDLGPIKPLDAEQVSSSSTNSVHHRGDLRLGNPPRATEPTRVPGTLPTTYLIKTPNRSSRMRHYAKVSMRAESREKGRRPNQSLIDRGAIVVPVQQAIPLRRNATRRHRLDGYSSIRVQAWYSHCSISNFNSNNMKIGKQKDKVTSGGAPLDIEEKVFVEELVLPNAHGATTRTSRGDGRARASTRMTTRSGGVKTRGGSRRVLTTTALENGILGLIVFCNRVVIFRTRSGFGDSRLFKVDEDGVLVYEEWTLEMELQWIGSSEGLVRVMREKRVRYGWWPEMKEEEGGYGGGDE